MRTRLMKLGAAIAAIAAIAVGGSALASAGSKASPPAPAPASQAQSSAQAPEAPDTGNVQQGDQSGVDTPGEEQASESGQADGPGGYADSSPNADTQQEGQH